ncbi:MAG: helix-turn-helix transcriptional regulator, partial [Clostridia bacterium]|nr:helix-turn-helix transcriptional regulator [Clostridia bacterium]
EAFSLVDRNQQELQRALQLQNEYLRNACINRLIRGSGHDALELEEMLAAAHIELSGDAFRAVIIVFEHLTASASAQALGLEVLGSFAPRLSVLSLEDTETVFALYSMKESETEVERPLFSEIYNALKDKANIESKFYLGGVCDSPDAVCDSFAQAAYIRSSLSEGTWLNVYSPAGADADLGCILGDAEQTHFKESILSGDSESVKQQLDYFENHYFIESSSHGFKRQYVFCRLVEALIACGQNLETKTELPDNIMNMTPNDFFTWFTGPCLILCEKAHDRLKQRNRQLIDEAIRYIDSHYSEYDLTLATLSDRLNLTSAYLSALFKKQLGTNFSVYIEQLRIAHAEELLSSGKMSIEEVAQNVGYGNADSFRRAFKRVKGVSPSKYSKSAPASGML